MGSARRRWRGTRRWQVQVCGVAGWSPRPHPPGAARDGCHAPRSPHRPRAAAGVYLGPHVARHVDHTTRSSFRVTSAPLTLHDSGGHPPRFRRHPAGYRQGPVYASVTGSQACRTAPEARRSADRLLCSSLSVQCVTVRRSLRSASTKPGNTSTGCAKPIAARNPLDGQVPLTPAVAAGQRATPPEHARATVERGFRIGCNGPLSRRLVNHTRGTTPVRISTAGLSQRMSVGALSSPARRHLCKTPGDY
jgi:hypothetical protein